MWAERGLQRVGCVSLSGVADDKPRALPMSASESFCVAVSLAHENEERGREHPTARARVPTPSAPCASRCHKHPRRPPRQPSRADFTGFARRFLSMSAYIAMWDAPPTRHWMITKGTPSGVSVQWLKDSQAVAHGC